LAAIADMGTAAQAVAEEGGQMWQEDSVGQSVVFVYAAMGESENETRNTAGSLEEHRLGASDWAWEAAAGFHGS